MSTAALDCKDNTGSGPAGVHVHASPAIATDLQVGDAVGFTYFSQNVEGPEVSFGLEDLVNGGLGALRLGFVDSGSLMGAPGGWATPLIPTNVACSDDDIRQAVTFDLDGTKVTVPDGGRGELPAKGANGAYVIQVETARIDPSQPSMPSHYTIVVARQP